jgi:hypothetical protein
MLLDFSTADGQAICGTEALHRQWELQDEDYAKRQQILDTATNLHSPPGFRADTIYIPVVFHVLWNAPFQQVSDARIKEQIDILNRDFQAKNADIEMVPEPFRSLTGSLPLKFVIANRNPSGARQIGILKIKTERTSFPFPSSDMKRSDRGGSNAWDSRYYLNIWICDLPPNILGFSTLPAQAGTTQDGVVLNYRYVGHSNAVPPYDLGRTATHEVGHWLNLRHIWGDDGDACSGTDFVEDTPNQAAASSGCPMFPKSDLCSPNYPGIMFMNYMDYTHDACMQMFTEGQAKRMQTTLFGPRASILQSQGYVMPLENDIAVLSVSAPGVFHCTNQFSPVLFIQNTGSNILRSVTAKFSMSQEETDTVQWEGQLDPGDSIAIYFSKMLQLPNGQHKIHFNLSSPNGQPDSDSTNNSLTHTFILGNALIKPLPFIENFSNDPFPSDGWEINNPDGLITWQITTAAFKTAPASIFLNNYEYDPSMTGVPTGQVDELISPFLDFQNSEKIYLSFQIAAAQYTPLNTPGNEWDTLRIFVSTDCGITSTKVYEKSRFSLVTTTVPTTFPFIPLSFQWRKEIVDLSNFVGYDAVQLVFSHVSNWENNIYIDEIAVNRTSITSTGNKRDQEGVIIFPNPSSGTIYLKIKEQNGGMSRIVLTDIVGKAIPLSSIHSISDDTIELSVGSVAAGTYILTWSMADGTTNSSRIIIR